MRVTTSYESGTLTYFVKTAKKYFYTLFQIKLDLFNLDPLCSFVVNLNLQTLILVNFKIMSVYLTKSMLSKLNNFKYPISKNSEEDDGGIEDHWQKLMINR